MNARIDRIWPDPAADLDDDALLAAYPFPEGRAWVRMNFVSSLDGAATRSGLSGGLGDDADHRVFDLLRREADVVLLGAGTARAEGYGAMRVDEAAAAWRTAAGLPPHPVFALVSRDLDLDPRSPVFTEAPVRPIVYTVEHAPAERRARLETVADVVVVGRTDAAPPRILDDLAARGLARIHSEGGPHLLGSFIDADALDELCLTVAPTLEGGAGTRIAVSANAHPRGMTLAGVLRADDELLLRYTRER